jgi:hypothetical protein
MTYRVLALISQSNALTTHCAPRGVSLNPIRTVGPPMGMVNVPLAGTDLTPWAAACRRVRYLLPLPE